MTTSKSPPLPQHFERGDPTFKIVKLEGGIHYCLSRRPDGKWYYLCGIPTTRPLPRETQAYLDMMSEAYQIKIARLESALRAAGVEPATIADSDETPSDQQLLPLYALRIGEHFTVPSEPETIYRVERGIESRVVCLNGKPRTGNDKKMTHYLYVFMQVHRAPFTLGENETVAK